MTAFALRQQATNKRDHASTRAITTNDTHDTSSSSSSSSGREADAENQEVSRHDLIVCIVKQLWPYLNPAICNAIRASVEPLLRDLPGPLTTLRFTELDLGIEHFVLGQATVHDLKDGFVQFDMDVHWTTNRQISLKASYVGSMGVERIELTGRLAVVLKPLTKVLPCVSGVQLYFIDPPKLQLNFTGLAEIADIQLVKNKVLSGIASAMNNIVVAPYSYVGAKLDPDCDYFNIYRPPVSVVRVTLLRGEGFADDPRVFSEDDVPDVYCQIALGASQSYRSRTIWDNNNPVWDRDEFFDFLLYDYGQSIFLQAWDEGNGPMDSDDDLGKADIVVRDLLVATQNRTVKLPLIGKDGNPTGAKIMIRCDLLPFVKNLQSLTEQATSNETMGGLITVLIDHAFGVPVEAMESMHVTSKVRVQCGDDTFETLMLPGTNPHYNMAFHIPISTEAFSKGGGKDITLRLYKCLQENLLKSPEETLLGGVKILYSALSHVEDKTITETQPIGTGGTTLRFRVLLQGIDWKTDNPTSDVLASASVDAATDVRPTVAAPKANSEKDVGTVKLTAVQGRDFKIQRRFLQESRMANAYLKIQVGSRPDTVWRTKTIDNSREPMWNETSAFVLSSKNETIQIEAYDDGKGRNYRDDKLGSAQLTVDDILLAGGSKEVELEAKDKPTGTFITIKCEKVAS